MQVPHSSSARDCKIEIARFVYIEACRKMALMRFATMLHWHVGESMVSIINGNSYNEYAQGCLSLYSVGTSR